MGHANKSDEFSENFQTAFAPPPPFSENYAAILFGKGPEKNLYKVPKSAT